MVLYRYLKSHGLETLRDGRFKMASVLDLNDPFEGAGRCVGVLSEETVKNLFKEKLLQNGIEGIQGLDAAWNLLGKEETHSLSMAYSDEIRAGVFRRTLVSFMYVLCFSMCDNGDPAQKLMWSHYANGYRGVRIGLRLEDPNFPLYLDSMKYCWERPALDLSKVKAFDKDEEIIRFWIQNLTTKSIEWSYERECRIIAEDRHLEKGQDDKGNVTYFWRFDPSVVVSVDVGFQMPETDVKKIIDVAKVNYPTAMVRKVVLGKDDYGISYQEVF